MPKKKVKDCTIKELESYFIKKYCFRANQIVIFKKEIHFERYIKGWMWNSVELVLDKEEEIEVEQNGKEKD